MKSPTRAFASKLLHAMTGGAGDFAEIYFQSMRSSSITFEDGKLRDVACGEESGAGLRVLKGGKVFFESTNDPDEDRLLAAARNLAASAGSRGSPPGKLKLITRSLPEVCPVKIMPSKVSQARKASLARRADAAARAFDSRVKQVAVHLFDRNSAVTIANSDGVFDADRRVDVAMRVSCIAARAGELETGLCVVAEKRGYELFEDRPPEELGREAARLAVVQLEAEPAPAGRFMVVLSSKAGGTIVHEACGHGLEGDFVRNSLSVFAERAGQVVASPLVTVVDDGTLPNRRGSSKLDDEGTPARRNVLIEAGVLRGYMHDLASAREAGEAPTGNGRRESFRHIPIPRMTNTFVSPGRTPPAEIIASVKDGILVSDMGGGQVDIVGGDFVFKITEGYLIEDGKIGRAVRGATLIGNGPQVLLSVDMVGGDLEYFAPGTCGKEGQHAPVTSAVPTMRIPSITIGGIVR